jgi:hypothetical protein
MDVLTKLSREAQIVLGGGLLLLIISFFDWQQVSFNVIGISGSAGLTEWHGIGILAVLLVIAMLVWEVLRLLAVRMQLGGLSEGLVSVALALLVALFTVITFLTHSTARHWPAWIGLIVALVVAAAALARARGEGVQMPEMKPGPTGGASE